MNQQAKQIRAKVLSKLVRQGFFDYDDIPEVTEELPKSNNFWIEKDVLFKVMNLLELEYATNPWDDY